MKRITALLLCILLSFVFCACKDTKNFSSAPPVESGTEVTSDVSSYLENGNDTDETFETFMSMIGEQNCADFINLFSENTKYVSPGLGEQTDLLFGLGLINYTAAHIEDGPMNNCTRNGDEKKWTVSTLYLIETTIGKYYVFIEECIEDTADRGNEGINRMVAEPERGKKHDIAHYADTAEPGLKVIPV